MSKVNQIQTELKSIDGGSFQKLCDLYLMQNPRYKDLKPIGSVIGKDKTKTGVPDSLIILPDNTLALAHYTTTQGADLPGKLRTDFQSSFDEEHTGIPVDRIKEIIFCYNDALDTKTEISIFNEGRVKGVLVTFRGLERIAYDLFDKYQGLAKEFLNVEVDSGQIVTPQEFIAQYGKSSLSTSLDTAFHFRSDELKSVLTALGTKDLVLITGSAGAGKSRLMLEVAQQFSTANEGWTVRCIFNRGFDLSQDLKVYFRRPGKYLILVDDANRLSGFEYILQLLHDQTSDVHIKIIATVRDYARDKVLECAKPFGGGHEEQLRLFTDDQIRTLISDEGGIKDFIFSTRILSIAQGNPRLAMMASKLAVERQTLNSIDDVTSLYDEYFGSVRKILEEIGEKAISVIAIISFFRVVDRSNGELMDIIAQTFNIPPSVFWHTVDQLNRIELVDLYEQEVAKVSDQVLATYLFYFAVFKSGTLDFSIFLDRLFPRYHSLFIEALNPVINSLGARIEERLRPQIVRKWKEWESEGREEELLALILAFWFVCQTETLIYIQRRIGAMPVEQVDVDSLNFKSDGGLQSLPFIDLLGSFYGTRHYSTALELLFEAFTRNPRLLPNVFHVLKNDFSFRPNSSLLNFAPQQAVMNQLWERADNGSSTLFTRLFLAIAGHYLRTDCEVRESKKRALVFIRFKLYSTPVLTSLRRSIWERILSLYSLPDFREAVINLLSEYSNSGYLVSSSEILSADSEVVIPFILTALDPENFNHVLMVQDYLRLLDHEGVQYEPVARVKFTNRVSRLAELLFADRFHRSGESSEDEETLRSVELRAYVENFSVEDYRELFRQFIRIQQDTPQSKQWQLQRSIGEIFETLESKGAEFYKPLVSFHLELGSPFGIGINGRQVIHNLIRFYGLESAYDTISSREFPSQTRWLFEFFASIPPDEVSQSHLDQLYHLYCTAPPASFPTDFRFLELYMQFDEHVVTRVIGIILSRMEREQDSSFAFVFGLLFNPYATTSEKLLSYFGRDNIPLLKSTYLASQRAHDHTDHDGRVFSLLLDLDRNFLREYISLLVEDAKGRDRKWLNRVDDSMDFSFLWRREDFEEITRDILQFLFELKQADEIYIDGYLDVVFLTRRGFDEPKESDITERQAKMLEGLIAERATDADFMVFVFETTGGLPKDRRRELIATFLQHNARVDDFKRLSIESTLGGWMGSAVPYFQKRLEFAESLLPLVEGLDFLEHRLHIEKLIEYLQKEIEREKRHDFMRDA